MARRFQAVIFLISVVCLIGVKAYSSDGSTNSAASSEDGVEYVYVSLSSDIQSYQLMPKDGGKPKVLSSNDKAKINTDMSSYQVISKGGIKDRLPYYQSIREKILARLKRNYTSHYSDGDVHLFFILDKKGTLVRVDVALSESTKDIKLINTALLSLQQAAPFGPFPKEMNSPQVLFSLIVSFKKDIR